VFVKKIELGGLRNDPLEDDFVCDLCMALVVTIDAAEFELADSKGKLRHRAGKKFTSRSFSLILCIKVSLSQRR
jgi:hypothetical protein